MTLGGGLGPARRWAGTGGRRCWQNFQHPVCFGEALGLLSQIFETFVYWLHPHWHGLERKPETEGKQTRGPLLQAGGFQEMSLVSLDRGYWKEHAGQLVTPLAPW